MTLAERLKAFRGTLQLKQEEIAAQSDIPLDTYRKYEGGSRQPGADALAGLVLVGINANWLLTGKGTMLRADLAPKPPEAAPALPPQPQINIDALGQALAVMLQTAKPGETLQQSAVKAVQFYLYLVEKNLITPEGEGTGNLKSVA